MTGGRRSAGLLSQLGACGLLLGGCGPGDWTSDPQRFASRAAAVRPTDGSGWSGNGYGIPAQVYDPAGGHFRVYYVQSGDSAIDPADVDPKDGIPDFPQLVGAVAEATYQSTIALRGFRPPLDDSVYHDRPDYGGDGRYDIYLRRSGPGSDGYRVSEVCTDGSAGDTPGRCAGYFVMNPSFRGTSYPSERAAVEVLVSHELFHSVQDAYSASQWRTWTEATAVWNELQVFPQGAGTFADYLGFLPALFSQPERPFDKSMGAGPAASYAYGTAAWAEFLSERFSPSLIGAIWAGCEQRSPAAAPPNFLDATDAILSQRYGSSLAAAWTEFSRWNLLTGERAIPGHGYQRAAEYPLVRFEPELSSFDQPVSIELNGLAARYLRLRPTLSAATTVRLTLRDPSGSPVVAAAYLLAAGRTAPDPQDRMQPGGAELLLSPGDSLLLVATGAVRGARSRNLELGLSRVEPSPPPPEAESAGCAMSHSQRLPSGALPLPLLLLLAWVGRRRSYRNR